MYFTDIQATMFYIHNHNSYSITVVIDTTTEGTQIGYVSHKALKSPPLPTQQRCGTKVTCTLPYKLIIIVINST